jgi:hypothetical protein
MKSLWPLLWVPCLAGITAMFGSGCSPAAPATNTNAAFEWTKLADTSAWPKNYNFQMMTIHDTLWVFHHDGNWFSTDGRSWSKSSLPNAIGNPAFLDYVFFQNKIFGLGHFEGNTEEHTLRPTIYFSGDRMHWDSIENTNLQKRYFYHPFVFKGRIWIIGGEQDSNIWSDIINSADGIHWQIIKDKLPFGPVVNSQFLLYKEKIWMLNDDVWSSTDGYEWAQVSKSIVPGQKIFGYAAVAYDDKMWLIGCNRNGQFNSEVLSGEDGIHWTGQTAPWTPRGGVAAGVLKDKIIMTGGQYGGTPGTQEFVYSNDVWEMGKATADEQEKK